MSLEKLLENEAQSEIEAIRKKAQEKARKIISDAQNKAHESIESKKRLLEREYQAGIVRAKSSADLEINATKLNASEKTIEEVFRLADEQLRFSPETAYYKQMLFRLLDEARKSIPNATVFEVNPKDMQIANEIATEVAFGLVPRANDKISLGIRLLTDDGRSGITNTLPERMRTLKSKLTSEVRDILEKK